MSEMQDNRAPLTVFYDGSCPLCLREIGVLRRAVPDDQVKFEDVSPPNAKPSCQVDRERLMARFHVRQENGEIVEGAQAFTEVWSRVPWLVWVRPLGRFGPTRWLLDRLYDGFLKIRPHIQKRVPPVESEA